MVYCHSSCECHTLQDIGHDSTCVNQGQGRTSSSCCMQGPWVGGRGDLATPCQGTCYCCWFGEGTPGMSHCLPKQARKALGVIHPTKVSLFPQTAKGDWTRSFRHWPVSLNTPYVSFWIYKGFCGRGGNCTDMSSTSGQFSCFDASSVLSPVL